MNEAMPKTSAKRGYSVPAAEKALDIIEYMADLPDGLTATELANQLGRSVHEIYRVMQVLEARGYLYRRADSDRYRLSMKLFELAHKSPSVRQLTDAALPVMQALAPTTMQSCHLAVLSRDEAMVVLQIDSPLPMRYSVMLGARFAFDETSSGVVVYAYSPEPVREQMDERMRQAGRSDSLASVHARASRILELGYEMRPSLAVGGVTNVSVPVFDYPGHVVGAFTTPYVPQRAATVSREDVLERTIAAGRRISANLGAGQHIETEWPSAAKPPATKKTAAKPKSKTRRSGGKS